MLRFAVLAAVAACYQSAELPPVEPPVEPCSIACDFAGAGSAAACPTGTCLGTAFLDGVCVDGTASCETVAPEVAGRPFTNIQTLLSEPIEEDDPSLTGDQLELYLLTSPNLYVARRANTELPFEMPQLIEEIDVTETQLRPCVSTDGLTLLFARRMVGTPNQDDIFITTRASRGDKWTEPVPLPGDINTSANELPAWISPDRLTLVFEADTAGTNDLFIVRREAADKEFVRAEARSLAAINTDANERRGGFDETGTIFLFESSRTPSMGTALWEAVVDPGAPDGWKVVEHPELDAARGDGTPWLSPDGKTVVFSTNRAGTGSNDDLFMATR